MEHVLHIGVSVDDDAIVRRVEAAAEKKIIEDLRYEVARVMLQRTRGFLNPEDLDSSYGGRFNLVFTEYAKSIMDGFLAEHKDEIINAAGEALAEKMARTKAVKEKIGEVVLASL